MKFLILLLFFFSLLIVNAQELDSIDFAIKQQLDTISTQKNKLEILLNTANTHFITNPTKAKKYYLKAAAITKEDNLIDKANIYSQLGVISRKEGLFSEAYTYFYKGKKLYLSLKDTFNISKANLNLGIVYRFLNETKKEVNFYKKSYYLAKKIKDTLLIGQYYNGMGGVYRRSKKLDSAQYCYEKALQLFEKVNSERNIIIANNNLSVLYGNQKKHQKAIKVKLNLLNALKNTKDQSALSLNYYNLAISYAKLKEYQTALLYADSSTTIAEREGYRLRIARAHKLRGSIYARISDYEKAYNSSVLYKQQSDAIFNLQKQKKIKELELKNEFDIERKELELIAHQRELKSKFYIILFSLILFFVLLIAFLGWKNYKTRTNIVKEKLEKEKLKKEILAQKVKTSESELKSIIADNTMRLEFIKQLSNQIKTDKGLTASDEIKKYTNSLLLKLQQQIGTESKLSSLKDKINVINQGFDQKIIELYPNLTKTEREICTLLRLNLSIKEIASIRNSSTDSIKAARYRIRKKIAIPKNKELEYFIQNLTL